MFKNTILILFCGLLFGSQSCKSESFGDPPIPSLKLKTLLVLKHPITGLDSIIIAELDYKDGDGDIGLSESDTFTPFRFDEPYFTNLWVDLEYKQNGSWVLTSFPNRGGFDDSLQLSQRIVNLTPVGEVKSIKGTFTLRIPVKPTPFFTHKEVRFTFTLVDRSQQQSNSVRSSDILLNY